MKAISWIWSTCVLKYLYLSSNFSLSVCGPQYSLSLAGSHPPFRTFYLENTGSFQISPMEPFSILWVMIYQYDKLTKFMVEMLWQFNDQMLVLSTCQMYLKDMSNAEYLKVISWLSATLRLNVRLELNGFRSQWAWKRKWHYPPASQFPYLPFELLLCLTMINHFPISCSKTLPTYFFFLFFLAGSRDTE